MEYTKEAGSLLRRVDVGFLAPVLVVRKGCEKEIRRIEDLAQPELDVVPGTNIVYQGKRDSGTVWIDAGHAPEAEAAEVAIARFIEGNTANFAARKPR